MGALLLASLTGAMGMAAGKHSVSDVASGAAIGFLSGFVLPVFVYPLLYRGREPSRRVGLAAW